MSEGIPEKPDGGDKESKEMEVLIPEVVSPSQGPRRDRGVPIRDMTPSDQVPKEDGGIQQEKKRVQIPTPEAWGEMNVGKQGRERRRILEENPTPLDLVYMITELPLVVGHRSKVITALIEHPDVTVKDLYKALAGRDTIGRQRTRLSTKVAELRGR